MNKFIIILMFLLYGCGYTSVYKENKNYDILVSILDMKGDSVLNNNLKNQLAIISDRESENIFNIILITNYEKIITSKNAAGLATDYKLQATVNLDIKKNDINKKITFSESFNIKNEGANFEQTNYENSIKRNFAILIKDKLVLYLLSFDDN
tara:strand:- start:1145 stop:1600 length:456 start_codon:yes stop_codon:yes gene_type:complete